MMSTREDFIQGLRECAIFLEQHSTVPIPPRVTLNVFGLSKETLSNALHNTGGWTKNAAGLFFYVQKTWGMDTIHLDLNIDRNQVCRRVVVGTILKPAVPEMLMDEVEWKCDESLFNESTTGSSAQAPAVSSGPWTTAQ